MYFVMGGEGTTLFFISAQQNLFELPWSLLFFLNLGSSQRNVLPCKPSAVIVQWSWREKLRLMHVQKYCHFYNCMHARKQWLFIFIYFLLSFFTRRHSWEKIPIQDWFGIELTLGLALPSALARMETSTKNASHGSLIITLCSRFDARTVKSAVRKAENLGNPFFFN